MCCPGGYSPPLIAGLTLLLPGTGLPIKSAHMWGVQDSNLRRLCHQIYSLTPLTARETPPKNVSSAVSNSPVRTPTQDRFERKI